ncbi:Protein ssh4 [Wickerhamiella sorbophila]|uniref:Protein ssh4 n=1 Tax=Wickerhamiella sorbophila TaxID=45607 RepID=A0A2T0FP93_9ASCO|nr:Protein ssh4 [Wickerhamiella sorbophila]PRT56805.1 Protein ssh4 [Wickerhamiella sorbophila]
MTMDDIPPQVIAIVVSFVSTFILSFLVIVLYTACTCERGIRLRDGLPGAFDDSEQFLEEEAAALETMDEPSKQSYLMAKRFIERNPPNSADTDISLSQFMAIQEKAVAAWEFTFDIMQQSCMVQDRTEIEFLQGTSCVQTNIPLPKQNETYYWEAKVYSTTPDVTISVGLSTKPYPGFRLPGMHRYSVAYCSNGVQRINQPFKAPKYGRPWTQGDVIGVGYRTRTGTVFFTHNGKKLPDVVHGMRVNVFPSIGASGPCTVVANLGQGGFVFIEANVKKWGLAPAHGTLAPPPAYGDRTDSVLLDFANVPSSSHEFPPPYGSPQRPDAPRSPPPEHVDVCDVCNDENNAQEAEEVHSEHDAEPLEEPNGSEHDDAHSSSDA